VKTHTSLATLALGLIILVGCGSPQPTSSGGVGAPSATTQASPAASVGAKPEMAACQDLQGVLIDGLQAHVEVTPATFRDLANGVEQSGCQIIATGTAATVGTWTEVSERMQAALTAAGWQNGQPLADGPTGTVIGFAREHKVAQLTVDWQPSAGASCPADQPISDCNLSPEQQQITVKIEAASTGVSTDSKRY